MRRRRRRYLSASRICFAIPPHSASGASARLSLILKAQRMTGAEGKLALTAAVVAAIIVLRLIVVGVVGVAARGRPQSRALFWTRQGAGLAVLVLLVVAFATIWIDDSARLTTVLGLASAGVAIAAQRAVTAFA